MHKVTSFILQLAMVSGAIYFRVNTTRAEVLKTQEQVSANVARALELINQARAAMGGEDALHAIQSLSVSGKSHRSFQDKAGQAQERSSHFKLYFVLPGKNMKSSVELALPPPPPGPPAADHIIIMRRPPRPGDGTATTLPQEHGAVEPGKRALRFRVDGPVGFGPPPPPGPMHFMLTSFLAPPSMLPIEYSYAGEATTAQGSDADIIEAKHPDGTLVRIFLDKQSHLPVSMSYRTSLPPTGAGNVIMFKRRVSKEGEPEGLVMPAPEAGHIEMPDVLVELPHDEEAEMTADENSAEPFQIPLPPPQDVEVEVNLSDFRAVGGVLLPHRMTQTFNGKETETWEVESFEINSPPRPEKLRAKN